MIAHAEYEIDWKEYIDREIIEHPWMDTHLIDLVWDELHAKDAEEKGARFFDATRHRSNMLAAAKEAIAAVKETSRTRMKLQRWDEFQNGVIRNTPQRSADHTEWQEDALDDLLIESEAIGDGETTAQAQPSNGVSSETQNIGDDSAESAQLLAAPVADPLAYYEFPETAAHERDYDQLSDGELIEALRDLVTDQAPYHVIRDRYTAIACIMNRRGVFAPKFRPQHSLPRNKKVATDDMKLMMRDRQVIDMHWLHCRGKRDVVPGKCFANIFVGDELDFSLASQLASKEWKLEIKAERSLNLFRHEQLPLAILRGKEVADDWRNAERSMLTTIDKRLREQALTNPSLKSHIEDFKRLWLAEKIIGRGKGRLPLIAQMHGWISGKAPLATSTLSEKLKRMRIRTGPQAGRVKGVSGTGARSKDS